jgi:hypothetical protein
MLPVDESAPRVAVPQPRAALMAKRTRTRARPKPPPPVETDQTILELDELAVLWPHLAGALARDTAGPSAEMGRAGGGGGKGSPAVLNLDVQQAQVEISVGVQRIAAEVVRLLKLDRDKARSTAGIIAAMPDWYVQLRNRNQPLAGPIKSDATSWLRTARSALRLRTYEEPIGWRCPDHRRDHPTELRREADEARLSSAVLAGRVPALDKVSGLPIEPALSWQHSESVFCPKCGRRWSGVAELRVLMRMIEQVERPPISLLKD